MYEYVAEDVWTEVNEKFKKAISDLQYDVIAEYEAFKDLCVVGYDAPTFEELVKRIFRNMKDITEY